MSDKERTKKENVTTDEATQFEITELDDLDLAGVAGGNEEVAEAALGSNRRCTNIRCR